MGRPVSYFYQEMGLRSLDRLRLAGTPSVGQTSEAKKRSSEAP